MDPRIEGQYTLGAAVKAAALAVKCLASEPRNRPVMDDVVKALEQLQDLRESGSVKSELVHQKKQMNFGDNEVSKRRAGSNPR